MATQKQLKDARNAGLNLAHVTQEYAQGDIALATEADVTARAKVKAAADAAATAAVAVGGTATPAPGSAVVTTGTRINIKDKDGNPATTTAELTVTQAGVVSGTFIASGVAIIPTAVKQSVGPVTGTGTFATFTVVNGNITGVVLSES